MGFIIPSLENILYLKANSLIFLAKIYREVLPLPEK